MRWLLFVIVSMKTENYVPKEITNEKNEKFVNNSIGHLEAMEAEIRKCRKNGKKCSRKIERVSDRTQL